MACDCGSWNCSTGVYQSLQIYKSPKSCETCRYLTKVSKSSAYPLCCPKCKRTKKTPKSGWRK